MNFGQSAAGGGLDLSALGAALPAPPTKESIELDIARHTALEAAAWKSKDVGAINLHVSRIAGLNEALENMKKNIDVFTYRVQDGTARTVAKYTTSAAAAGTQTYYEDDIEEIGTAIRKEHPTLSSAKITSGYISHKKKVVTQLVKKQHSAFDSKWSVLFFLRSCKTEFSPSHPRTSSCIFLLQV